jgi:putative Ca2+/H+ antiporter (TMEM165/GDT1 family)
MIFMAEMGDKSQILAMTFANKYSIKKVFIGLFLGILLNHILAVFIGSQLNQFIPINVITFAAGILFVVFGLYSLRLSKDDGLEIKETKFGPIITIAILFFVGELGDKTQLAAITLSSDAQFPLIILLGTVLGMMFTSILGIFLGIKFGRKIPVVYMKLLSSFVFVLFGVLKITDNSMEFSVTINGILLLFVGASYGLLLYKFVKNEQSNDSLYILTASRLKRTYQILSIKLEDICLGTTQCGSCEGNGCLIGYTKNVVAQVLDNKEVNMEYIENKTKKDFNEGKVYEALDIILKIVKKDFNNPKYKVLHNVRNNFERILFNETIQTNSYTEYSKILNKKRGN